MFLKNFCFCWNLQPLGNHYRNRALNIKFGKKIADLREENGWSQDTLAAKLGIESSQLRRIEAGKTNITVSTLESIATVFGLKLNEISNIDLEMQEKFDLDKRLKELSLFRSEK